jgi:hypothetical protein
VSPGNVELVSVVVSWLATVPSFAAIIVYDERRLRGAELARSWPPSSRDAAIFGSWLFGALYGIVGVFIHFAATRRTWRGALLGLALAALLLLLDVGAQYGVEMAIDELGL